MATQDLNITEVPVSTGWTNATVGVLTVSDDARATDGRPGEFIQSYLSDAPGDFGSQNSITLHVEARVVGTVSRAKTLLIELRDGPTTVIESFTTTSLTATDGVYASAALARSDSLSVINGYQLFATVQEGAGMGDTATVEIDRLWATLDYAVGVLTLTPPLVTNSNTFYTPTVSPGSVALTPAPHTNTNTFHAAVVAATFALLPSLLTDADTFYAANVAAPFASVAGGAFGGDSFGESPFGGRHEEDLTQALTPSLYADADTFYAATVSATYALTPALYADADTFYSATVASTYALTPALYADADTFYAATVAATYAVTPGLYSDSDTFYGPTVSATYGIAPSLYSDADTFYAPTVQSVYALQPGLYVDVDTFPSPTVMMGAIVARGGILLMGVGA